MFWCLTVFYWQKFEPSKLVSIGCLVELTKELYFHLDQGWDWCGIDIGDGGDGGDDEDDDDDNYNGDNNGDDDDDADINFGDKEGGMCFTILKTNIDIELNWLQGLGEWRKRNSLEAQQSIMHFFCFIPMSFGAKYEFRYYLNCSIQLSLGLLD